MMSTTKSKRKCVDSKFFKSFPGLFIIIQLTCCLMGFFLGVAGPYSKSGPHSFFLVVMALASFSTTCWIVVHICEAKSSSLLKDVNWNKVGIIHSGVFCFFAVAGSSSMIEVSYAARSLRAAGVFGFFSFTAFLIHFCWEVTRYLDTAMPGGAVVRATLSRGHHKDATQIPNHDDNEDSFEPVLEGTFRPLQPSNVYITQEREGQAEVNYTLTVKTVEPTIPEESDSIDSSDEDNARQYNFSIK